ncbi:unnamed protein product [Spodoptera exigua]|nr:unnamed protein product [Spodoptera exigua]
MVAGRRLIIQFSFFIHYVHFMVASVGLNLTDHFTEIVFDYDSLLFFSTINVKFLKCQFDSKLLHTQYQSQSKHQNNLRRFSAKMTNPFGVSAAEYNLIKQQAQRRSELRKEFLKQRTNPFKHASEAGYVFDPAMQKFLSMKVTQLEHFQANTRTSLFGICTIVIPMFAYGYILWKHRTTREDQIRKGELRYKDRMFKLQ